MIRDVEHDYYMWLRHMVATRPLREFGYNKLLKYLYHREFVYEYDMDSNRAEDGIALRSKYCYITTKDDREAMKVQKEIDASFGRNPCSMLEMMIGLCYRHDRRYSEQLDTQGLFWTMVSSLGLIGQDDEGFGLNYVEDVIDDFLEHRYSRDGRGSLFYVPNAKKDMRRLDIWYQAMAYYNELPEIKEDYTAD